MIVMAYEYIFLPISPNIFFYEDNIIFLQKKSSWEGKEEQYVLVHGSWRAYL